jgi:hypothetical protein
LVWFANLLYIVTPANRFFPTFATTANSFGATSYGGPGLTSLVAAHPEIFAAAIALLTAYLAMAFLAGITVRIACVCGAVFNLLLLATQFATLTTIPGGTDVGPQPLYLVGYVALFVAPGGRLVSYDVWADSRWVRWIRGVRTDRGLTGTPSLSRNAISTSNGAQTARKPRPEAPA